MIAALAALLFLLAGFDVSLGSVDAFNLVAFGLVLLAVHLLVGDRFGFPRRG